MAKKKSTGAKRSKKNLWAIAGLEKRCQELIREGALLKKDGAEKVAETINAEFAEELEKRKKKLSAFGLRSNMSALIWTSKVQADLWRAHGIKMVDKFREAYTYIPEAEVARKLRKLKGVTHAESLSQSKAGMGRLNTDELGPNAGAYEFPRHSFKEPLTVAQSPRGIGYIINGALIGIKYPDIERNTLRRALADARKTGAAFVVLTNLTELWTRKTAGFLAVYRAMVSGIQVNPKRFPADYQQEVRDIQSGKITDKTIYQTLNERFVEILDGLHKIVRRPNGKGAEAGSCPVYIQLGIKEEELINAGAYYELRYFSIVEQNALQGELVIARNRLAEANRDGNSADTKFWSAEVARLAARKARAIITNHTGPEYERYRRRMRALVVKKLEAAIPNAKVISQGTAHLKVNNWIVKTVIPTDDKVSDGRLAAEGNTYGADVFADSLADCTIVCPAYSPNFRDVGREDSKDGKPVTKTIAVAPSCLDAAFLREEFRDASKFGHPVQQLIYDPSFKGGVLVLSWGNGGLHADNLPIEKLDRGDVSNLAFPNPKTEYITIAVNTDNHWGSPAKRYIWDPKQGIHLGVNEAAVELARRTGALKASDLRVHLIAELDDATNGNLWFKPHYQPDPQEMSIINFESWLKQQTAELKRASEKGDNAKVGALAAEINRISISQLYFRGEHFPFHQMMQVYDRHLDPLLDYYSAVLGRFVKAGLVIKGISQINGSLSDTRDLGVLNFPNGNHRVNTMERADLEGEYFARHVQARLAAESSWKAYEAKHPGFLRGAVRAPRFSNTTMGLGTITAPDGGYEWALRLLSSPAKLSSWSDLLAAVIRNDLARGDSTYGLLKRKTVTFFGDKHFYAQAQTDHHTYMMCAAGTHTDLYGDTGGFPPNNTGVCFVSLPAGGPEAGPIIVRRLAHDFLRDWFANPTPFDWDKFLPSAV
jgi:hypothetical protein